MLELGLKQPHHLDRGTGRPRYRHRRHVVGGEHLLDRAMSDLKALSGAPVPGHDHTLLVAQGEHGGAFRGVQPSRELARNRPATLQ
jgi:hypothetical protein